MKSFISTLLLSILAGTFFGVMAAAVLTKHAKADLAAQEQKAQTEQQNETIPFIHIEVSNDGLTWRTVELRLTEQQRRQLEKAKFSRCVYE
ncbi:MAG TPA: hypothetical protein VFA71_03915 [Terriglobales bacterium]|nr:hypothetical protein [Terriglobales bacterium]